MSKPPKVPVAIFGSGNIGSDLMLKISRLSEVLRVAALIGVDPASDGLSRAQKLGIVTTDQGIDGFRSMPEFQESRIFFDATSATAHVRNSEIARAHGKLMIDLTPAALGPFVVPAVNIGDHIGAEELNMVTCGGQATVPVVAAVSALHPVAYAEIVAAIAAKSAGPGTRANIDEFTETTAQALRTVGRAESGKAIIVLNPASPPVTMRDTVYCLIEAELSEGQRQELEQAIRHMVDSVSSYVPGYRLKQRVQFESFGPHYLPALNRITAGTKVSVFLEVTGAAHYLPSYAGNLDIMTSAAIQTAERIVSLRQWLSTPDPVAVGNGRTETR